jgi:hypothetical protein
MLKEEKYDEREFPRKRIVGMGIIRAGDYAGCSI